MDIKVPQELLQVVANYLSKRPYQEVASILGQLVQCKEVKEPEPEPTEE